MRSTQIIRRIKLLFLALVMVLELTTCGSSAVSLTDAPSEAVALPPSSEASVPVLKSTFEPESVSPIHFTVLSGSTGAGAAEMLNAADNAPSILHAAYTYTIANNNSELAAGLANGDIGIATVASNVAVNHYNRIEGGVRIIAVGPLGCSTSWKAVGTPASTAWPT